MGIGLQTYFEARCVVSCGQSVLKLQAVVPGKQEAILGKICTPQDELRVTETCLVVWS